MLENYPDVLTVHELSEILRIDKSTAYRMLQKEIIPSRRIFNAYRINKNAVLKYLGEDVKVPK